MLISFAPNLAAHRQSFSVRSRYLLPVPRALGQNIGNICAFSEFRASGQFYRPKNDALNGESLIISRFLPPSLVFSEDWDSAIIIIFSSRVRVLKQDSKIESESETRWALVIGPRLLVIGLQFTLGELRSKSRVPNGPSVNYDYRISSIQRRGVYLICVF
jgi:hypothetical protein